MILHNISTKETFYDILNVKEDASYEEIRSSYRSLLLISHPDKLQNSSTTLNLSGESREDKFVKVQKAWGILSDHGTRAFYDTKLQIERNAATLVADDLCLCDMMVEVGGDGEALELYYQCRCGDYFSVGSSDLEEIGCELSLSEQGEVSARTLDGLPGTVILPCSSCSLKVRLLINLDNEASTL